MFTSVRLARGSRMSTHAAMKGAVEVPKTRAEQG